jgi:acetyl-CoA carboxylase biotin carboxyl carrier protein
MQRYDLTAIDLAEGSRKIRLRRNGEFAAHPASAAQPAATSPAPGSPGRAPAAPSPAHADAGVFIESPMVGTFYSSSGPDAPPFVILGSVVRPESIVCVIEAMKVFTDIPAGVSGTIIEVLVKNGQPVEYGQALFRVEPA